MRVRSLFRVLVATRTTPPERLEVCSILEQRPQEVQLGVEGGKQGPVSIPMAVTGELTKFGLHLFP